MSTLVPRDGAIRPTLGATVNRLTPGACLPLAQVITTATRPFSSGPSATESISTGQRASFLTVVLLRETVQIGDEEAEQAPI
jgi:hypothetical protein